MQLLPDVWHIPHSAQQCKALNTTVQCNFSLYTNATGLTEDQKLKPNPEITGTLIFKSFFATAIASLLLACFLCYDKIMLRKDKESNHRHWLILVHTVETLLHTFSDQQLVSALSLLFTLNDQSCTISAYDYNVVCSMLLMSSAVHLSSLINITDFIGKGRRVAISRILPIILQIVLTGVVFSARNSSHFPHSAQSLAIMPAACFENMNAQSWLGLGDLVDFAGNVTTNTTNTNGNGTDTLAHRIETLTGNNAGLAEYIVLTILILLAGITILIEWLVQTQFQKHIGWGSIAVSIISTIVGIVLTGYTYAHWHGESSRMKTPELYQEDVSTPLTFSQILPWALLASSFIPAVNAMAGSLPEKSRRYVNKATAAGQAAFERMDKVGTVVGDRELPDWRP